MKLPEDTGILDIDYEEIEDDILGPYALNDKDIEILQGGSFIGVVCPLRKLLQTYSVLYHDNPVKHYE